MTTDVTDFEFWKAKAEKISRESEWISVDDRYPDNRADVLIYAGYTEVGFLGNDGHWWDDMGEYKITKVSHWMPLPEPPNGN